MSRLERRHRSRPGLGLLMCGLVTLASGCGLLSRDAALDGREPGSPDDPVPAWNPTQQGSDPAVKWTVFVGDSARQHLRCISLDLDPKPPSLSPRPNLIHPATGEPIPPPPPVSTLASAGGRQPSGCAPAPELNSMSGQPLYTLTAHQPEGGDDPYRYAAGTAVPEIRQITAEFTDGSTAPASVSQGSFIVIYPPTRTLSALRPALPKFPDLRCSVAAVPLPPLPGGGPVITTYADGGCTGYTVKIGPFGR